MSSSCCGNCGCDPCLCENPYQPDIDNLKEGTPVIEITGEPDTSCVDPDDICPVGPQCEEFTAPNPISLGDPDADPPPSLINVTVCDSSIYTVGMCVTIYATVSSTSKNQAVLRIDSVLDARTVTLEQYSNASDNSGADLSGTMYICPMSHCLEETVPGEAEECHAFKVLTDVVFTVPADDSATTSPMILAECTDLEAGDRIYIRDDAGEVGGFDIDSIVDGTDLEVTNPGLAGNVAPTTTAAVGSRVSFPTPFTLPEIPPANWDTYHLGLSLSGVPEWKVIPAAITTLSQDAITPMSVLTVFHEHPPITDGNIVPDPTGVEGNQSAPTWYAPLGVGDTHFTVPNGYRGVRVITDPGPSGSNLQLYVECATSAIGAGVVVCVMMLRGLNGANTDTFDFFINPATPYLKMFLHDGSVAPIGVKTGSITAVYFF
jgi:hypothetical protein